jgi:hypothetical protein
VTFPEPGPGLVIRYSYLWRSEEIAGRREGIKDRPCAVLVAVLDKRGRKRVAVLPVTHTAPARSSDAVEIPSPTKMHLGMDDARSWIVTTEMNIFDWPGPDLRPAKRGEPSSIAFGTLPAPLFARVRESFLENQQKQRTAMVRRDD